MKCTWYFVICGCAMSAMAQIDKIVCKPGQKNVRVYASADLKKSITELRCDAPVSVMGREAKKAYRIRLSDIVDGFVPLDNIQLGGARPAPKTTPSKRTDKDKSPR